MWQERRYVGGRRSFKKLLPLGIVLLIAALLAAGYYAYREVQALRSRAQALEGELARMSALQEAWEEAQAAREAADGEDAQPEEPEEPAVKMEFPAYTELYPDFYAPEPYHAEERVSDTVFLTFDDGPSNRTPEILEILEKEDIKATFFVVGHPDETNTQRMRDIVAQGHSLGMHSYSHDYKKVYASVEAFLEDMYEDFTLIREATGVTPTLFRCPGGSINSYNGPVYREILSEMLRRGFVPFDWNIDGGDSVSKKGTPAAKIVENVENGAKGIDRAVLLLHDAESKKTTVEALPEIIAYFREEGYRFDRLTPESLPVVFGYR